MVSFDIQGTTAHVLMLNKQKIIDDKKTASIVKALKEINQEVDQGKFIINPEKGRSTDS